MAMLAWLKMPVKVLTMRLTLGSLGALAALSGWPLPVLTAATM